MFILLTFLVACSNKRDHTGHAGADRYTCPMHPQIVQDKPGTCPICGMDLVKMGAASADGSIMLTESQIRLANITTTLTKLESIGESTVLTGRLLINEAQTEVVSSRVPGRIEKLYFKEIGQRVTQGQALYEIYSEELLTLQQEYLLALRQFEELKQSRYEAFVKASAKKLILFGMTDPQIKMLAERKKSDVRIIFFAPASGIVARIDAAEGQYVSEGSPMYRIEKLDQIWVEADLYPGESSLVKTGDIVRVQVSGFEGAPVEGKVTFMSPEYRQGTQIITMRAVIANPKSEFIPGSLATIILSHSEKKAIALPIDAVIRDAKGSHVWLLTDNGAFKPQMVKTGLENFEKIEITEGIREKQNVVITGAYLLYSELVLKKSGDPMAGHNH
ncbi:MAG TPA: efflux RND transporter periplasmic adaptor subunit [Cyclobacteriaceae bacterium]|nr:efflux RND transporter periplasmic adaptor subunit [Cyclobacteriaceae bacterium]